MSSNDPGPAPGVGQSDDESAGAREDDEPTYRFTVLIVGPYRFAVPVDDVRVITDLPHQLTRVPRTPAAVRGVTDLRGQITVVIDPRVHFPGAELASEDPSLLVLNRADQPAALIVDGVDGIESVPESDVLDARRFEDVETEGTAVEHPLVDGAIRIERRVGRSVSDEMEERSSDPLNGGSDGLGLDHPRSQAREDEVEVEEFSLDDEPGIAETAVESPSSEQVEVDALPILAVDRLLLASGPSPGEGPVRVSE